jgi:hypothetical protein
MKNEIRFTTVEEVPQRVCCCGGAIQDSRIARYNKRWEKIGDETSYICERCSRVYPEPKGAQ